MKQLGGLRVGGTELILCFILEIAPTDLLDRLFDNCNVSPSWFSLAGAPTISARLHPPSPSQILWLLPWHTDNEQP